MHILTSGCQKVWGHDGERINANCPYCKIEELEERIKELEGQDKKPNLSTCPGCGGPADNGHDRCVPPSPYYCTKCDNPPIRKVEE